MSWNTALQISKAIENPYNADVHFLKDLTVDGNANIGGAITVNLPLKDVLADGDDADGQDITNVGTLTTTDLNVNGTSTLTGNLFIEGSSQILVKDQGVIDLILSEPTLSKAYGINGNVSSTNDYGLVITGRNAGGVDVSLLTLNSSQSSQSGTMDCHNNRIVNVVNPVNSQDVATKAYADSLVSATPNIDQVLTAGNTASNQGINNVGNILNNGNISILGGNGAPSYTYNASIGANTLGIQSRIFFNSDGAGATLIGGNQINLSSGNIDVSLVNVGNIFSMGEFSFNRASPTTGSYITTPQVNITNHINSATDSATGTAMTNYVICGADSGQSGASGRNWMINNVYSGASQIAKMRIAIDKGYFSTAQHPVRIPSQYDSSYYGLILSSKGEYINEPTVSEAHIYCELSTKEKDKNAYGIYSNYDFPVMTGETADEQIYSLYIPQEIPETKIGYSNSGGEGLLWTCNINGNIEKGDYLCSSKIPGIAMKQDDDLKYNYSIFKSAFDCDFTNQNSTYPVHILDSDRNREWRDPDDHSKGFKYEMKTFTNVSHILDIYEDKYTIKKVNKVILTIPYDFKTNHPDLVGQRFRAMLIGGTYQN